MSRWGRRIFLLSDECEMKSGKIMALVKGVWEFCSYLFWPRWGRKTEHLSDGNGTKNICITYKARDERRALRRTAGEWTGTKDVCNRHK